MPKSCCFMRYNMVFTSVPIFVVGSLDVDVYAPAAFAIPKLYYFGVNKVLALPSISWEHAPSCPLDSFKNLKKLGLSRDIRKCRCLVFPVPVWMCGWRSGCLSERQQLCAWICLANRLRLNCWLAHADCIWKEQHIQPSSKSGTTGTTKEQKEQTWQAKHQHQNKPQKLEQEQEQKEQQCNNSKDNQLKAFFDSIRMPLFPTACFPFSLPTVRIATSQTKLYSIWFYCF